MNNIALGDVAEHVNISRIYFSQLFKQETGEKYIDFLNKVRIEKAKEYLAFYDMKTYDRITSYNVCYTKLLRFLGLKNWTYQDVQIGSMRPQSLHIC